VKFLTRLTPSRRVLALRRCLAALLIRLLLEAVVLELLLANRLLDFFLDQGG